MSTSKRLHTAPNSANKNPLVPKIQGIWYQRMAEEVGFALPRAQNVLLIATRFATPNRARVPGRAAGTSVRIPIILNKQAQTKV